MASHRLLPLLFLSGLSAGPAVTVAAAPAALALVGATLLDGTGGRPVPDAVVLVREGRIECAGSRATCPVPPGVEVKDVSGLFVVPGLVDAHVHFCQTGFADGRPDALDLRDRHPYEIVEAELKKRPERFLRSYVCSGVTATFDVGGFPWTLRLPLRADADPLAPHVEAAGPLLSTIDHWLNLPAERQFIFLKDEAAAREGVRYLAANGASAVKVWYIVNKDHPVEASAPAVLTAGDEARKKGLPLIVHATGLAEAKVALKAGARVLVHSVMSDPVDQEFLDLAKKAGTIYCPTLTVVGGYVRMFDAVLAQRPVVPDDPNDCVDPETKALLAETADIPLSKVDVKAAEARRERTATFERNSAANLKRVRDAGIPIAMGTDAGNPLTLHGVSVHAEMEAMQAAGLTPMEVLVASTRGGATAMGREKDLGTVEKGKQADLLVVGADPSADITNLRKIRYLVRGGALHTAAELSAAASGM